MVLHPFISLCSGAGGLDLGVERALRGARAVCYVEHEVTACEVLAARIADGALHDAPIWTDLHAFDGRPWRGRVAGIIGGYPCQPFSVAGKRLGVNDPRHLWPSIERIIGEVEPRWCFFENVGGHLRLGYFDVVKPGLERLGYRVTEGLFTAAEVGAPHQRERLFILGVADTGRAEQRRAEEPASVDRAWAPDDGGGTGRALADATLGGFGERGEPSGGDGQPGGSNLGLADAGGGQLSQPWRGAQGRDGAGPAGTEPDVDYTIGARREGRERSGTPGEGTPARRPASESSGLGDFPPGPGDAAAWRRILAGHPELAPAVEPSVRLLVDGLAPELDLSRTAQLRITGNGVVSQCAALAFRTLWRQLADAGHTEQPGGQMRTEAKGKHAMSLHHVVEEWGND